MQVFCALFLAFFMSPVNCYSFNTKNVQIISQNSVKNTYFSYSLLLQAGEKTSTLIVGAPKNVNNPLSGGDIYKCDLNENSGATCIQYPTGRTINSNTPNGNFFGMKLDGDSHVDGALVACTPRTVPTKIYLRGYCIYMKNTSQVTKPPIEIIPLKAAGYDSTCCDSEGKPYYNLGFAMAGFDVSYQSEENILLGAPGVKKFNGAVLSYSINTPRIISMLPYRNAPTLEEEDSYFGYSVAAAEFQRNNKEVWMVTGAPRANHLRGKVTVYFYDVSEKEKMFKVTSFEDDEMGSYFGAAILPLDVTNDRVVDMLVGAPTSGGKTWDEGAVYFYKGLNEKAFLRRIKLTGSSKMGSRFGSCIVSLGDFDLDGCNDIAISAPYEDQGRGAVYIYRGSPEGLTDQFSQRLSPEDFIIGGTSGTKGFGMGISKGNDIDGNGHNDIAIGAYKSDQVFIIKSYSIIDYRFHLVPEINSINNETTGFNLKFCLIYTKRSEKPILPKVNFAVTFEVDYRSEGGNIHDQIAIVLGKNTCKDYNIQLKQTFMDISPFQINVNLDVKTENIVAHGDKSSLIQIPYSHGCGDDNVCDTELTIELRPDRQTIVLGLNKEISLNIAVNNDGEPAYQCEIRLAVPDGLELRNLKDCVKTEGNYTCALSEKLMGSTDKTFVFNLRAITPDIKSIDIRAEVISLGINKATLSDRAHVQLPIILENTPYILSKSSPKNMELELETPLENVEVLYQFSVGNSGPSPLQLDVDILIPIVEHDGENILNIVDVTGLTDDIQVSCSRSVIASEGAQDLAISFNRTVVVACQNQESCLKFSCQGDYLYGPAELATFKIRINIKTNLLAAKYKNELLTKNLIALVPAAYQNNINGDRVSAYGVFLIFVHGTKFVPLWVYLLAPTIGVLILIIISYALYRCHFFDRIYKDKLEQEKTLISNDAAVEDEIFDDVVFRSMEENTRNKEKEYIM